MYEKTKCFKMKWLAKPCPMDGKEMSTHFVKMKILHGIKKLNKKHEHVLH